MFATKEKEGGTESVLLRLFVKYKLGNILTIHLSTLVKLSFPKVYENSYRKCVLKKVSVLTNIPKIVPKYALKSVSKKTIFF